MKYRCIALGLLALTATAQADVKVNFVNPEKFSDIRDNNGFRRLEFMKFDPKARKHVLYKEIKLK